MTPFLKWPGGKARLAERILRELPDADSYVEPFLGAGAVALLAMRQGRFQHYVLADADADLIGTWNAIKTTPNDVLTELRTLLLARGATDGNSHYYHVRDLFNTNKGCVRTAARLLYLNTFGFNGLYRKNRAGGFNVPAGRPSKNPPARAGIEYWETKIEEAHNLLNKADVHLLTCDFRDIMVPAGAVGFMDPPYVPRQGGGFTQYTADGFPMRDQEDLARHFRQQQGFCLQTNGAGAAHLYEGLPSVIWDEPTSVGRDGSSRGSAPTLVVTNRPAH